MGVIVDVSVGIRLGVSVGGSGVGEAAAAVWVSRLNAACATAVATVSTFGVACGAHAVVNKVNSEAAEAKCRKDRVMNCSIAR